MALTRKIVQHRDNAIANNFNVGRRKHALFQCTNVRCTTINCLSIHFRRRCIPHEWVCDKDFDCSGDDKSDEDETICKEKKCLPNQSECTGADHCTFFQFLLMIKN